jgi:hypothetical protein
MANCMIGYPNRIDASTLSGGSWTAGLPQVNLQNRIIGQVARTTDATAASSIINIDLGSSKNIRLLSLRNHNISVTGQYRVRGSDDNTFATSAIDTGTLDVWPVVYPFGTSEWEDDSFWSGQYTAEQIAGYTTELVVILSASTVARYWRIEITDTTNAAGYIQAGRVFIGPAWQPIVNMIYGASIGWTTQTQMQRSLGGSKYFQRRNPYRVETFTLDYMTEDIGMSNAFEIDRRAGIDGEILWVHDPADTVHALRRQFLATLQQLSPIQFPVTSATQKAYAIEEAL